MAGSQTLYIPFSSPEEIHDTLAALGSAAQPAGSVILLRISPRCDAEESSAQLFTEFRALRAALECHGYGPARIVLYRGGGTPPRSSLPSSAPGAAAGSSS